jgi:hypothetical protein
MTAFIARLATEIANYIQASIRVNRIEPKTIEPSLSIQESMERHNARGSS